MKSIVTVCAVVAFGASSAVAFASSATPKMSKQPESLPTYPNQRIPWPTPSSSNSASLDAARKEAAAEAKGIVTPQMLNESSNSFTTKYKLYVNCASSPAGQTYSTVQKALSVAVPYTTIDVCPGSYDTSLSGLGPAIVATSFIKIKGVSAHSGSETFSCGTTADPTDFSIAFLLLGSHDEVENVTINDCTFGVGTGLLIAAEYNEVENSWFNDDYVGLAGLTGYKTEIENNHFNSNLFPIALALGTKDCITGNTIEGDGTGADDGILILDSVSDKIESNTVSGAYYGLDFEVFNSFNTIESNHFNGNYAGTWIAYDNSGNTLEKNYANGNEVVGFYSDDSSGAAALVDSGPNKFEKNSAFGNGEYDYFDGTGGYTGTDPNSNADTADYYVKNKGVYAVPPEILNQ